MSARATLIEDVLQEYGSLTRTALSHYLPAPADDDDELYDAVADYPQRGGKMLRPALCIATARAFGAEPADALATAVSIELLHNALLIKDDIEDGSDERRGRPTLHRLHGIPLALNAGDMLSLMSLQPLKDNFDTLGTEVAGAILEETEHTAVQTWEGQALELRWRRENRFDVDERDYLVMVLKKTCWLGMIHPSRAGALIGSGGRADLDRFVHFGFMFGAAFQIQDDLLNLVGGDGYGKERNGDLWEGKRTLMLGHLYQSATAREKRRIRRALNAQRDERDPAEVTWLRQRMERYGSLEYARTIAQALTGAALREYDGIYGGVPDSRDKRFIRSVVTWMIERTH